MNNNPRYPVFIPTKGRYKTPLTIMSFKAMGIPFRIVVEDQEYKEYSKIVGKKDILVVPHKNKGLTVTRNWIWDFCLSEGYKRFWTFDDNIGRRIEATGKYCAICRFNKNKQIPVTSGVALKVIEDFTERYENILISGMHYFFFHRRKSSPPPFYSNTRIYSNMLIKTDIPYRNETFYNDDTDLCLRILKDGFCTALFNSFLIYKAETMKIKGGMTDFYNSTNNRLEFAQELKNAHPDVVKITKKYGRYHHHVDYRKFKKNMFIRKKDSMLKKGVNEYGMVLKKQD